MYYLSAMCCVCFEIRKKLHDLNDIANRQLMQKFQYCTFGIGDMDSVPLFICDICCCSLDAAYEFKKSCAINIARLGAYVTQLKSSTSQRNNMALNSTKLFSNKVESGRRHEKIPRQNGPPKEVNLYSDIQVHIVKDQTIFNSPWRSVKTKYNPILNESQNCRTENFFGKADCSVDSNDSIEGSICLSDIVKEEHEITLTEFDYIPIKFDEPEDEESNLVHSMKDANLIPGLNINYAPTSSNLQSSEGLLGFGRSPVQNPSGIFMLHAEMVNLSESLNALKDALDAECKVAAVPDVCKPSRGKRQRRKDNPVESANVKRGVLIQSKDKLNTYTCDICNERFAEKYELNKHLRIHGKPVHVCIECGKFFTCRSTFMRHVKNHSSPVEKLHKCTLCPKQYYYKGGLNRHIFAKHQTHCSKCDKVFKSSEEFNLHWVKEHYKFKCEECGKVFVWPRVYRAHMVRHTGRTSF